MRKMLRVWRLRSHLTALLISATLLTFALVGGALMAYRIPKIEHASQSALQDAAQEMSERMRLLSRLVQMRIQLLDSMLDGMPQGRYNDILDSGTNKRVLTVFAIYRLSSQGRVQAAGLLPELRARRGEVLGRDLSSDHLVQAVAQGAEVAWGAHRMSVLTGLPCVTMAMRDPQGRVMMAEVSIDSVLNIVQLAAAGSASPAWITERGGEIIAQVVQGRASIGADGVPSARAHLLGTGAGPQVDSHGTPYHMAVAHAPELDWYVVRMTPRGLANPDVRDEVLYLAAALAGCLLMGLLTAPFWASRLARPLQEIVVRAGQAKVGHDEGRPWPRGPVFEFNSLSDDLKAMEGALRERQQKSQAIFNAIPVPMAVVDADHEDRFLDLNEAWCREYGHTRETVIGRTASEVGLFRSPQDEAELLAQIGDGRPFAEARLVRGNGEDMWAHVYGGRSQALNTERLKIWATVDIAPERRIEQELRELNQQLESRVQERTYALAASNDALSQTVERLRAAQDNLVVAEKLASLGGLVAGVAHELNTPLGNGVIAVSAMDDAARRIKASMETGLKRTDLQQFVDSVTQGSDIAGRNLRRAADLVQSFKQVAVDQTSSQRRSFEVGEVVHEIVVSLRPSFKRGLYQIEVDVPAHGLRLDSYPGPLGQVIANLIQNAVVHGFDGRDHGVVRVTAWRDPADERIVLRVVDDGKGIPAAVLPRVFEPFVTTKQGNGGSGLGLHISYNAIVNLIGGTLTVHSQEGQGAVFEMRLPARSPRTQRAGPDVA